MLLRIVQVIVQGLLLHHTVSHRLHTGCTALDATPWTAFHARLRAFDVLVQWVFVLDLFEMFHQESQLIHILSILVQ